MIAPCGAQIKGRDSLRRISSFYYISPSVSFDWYAVARRCMPTQTLPQEGGLKTPLARSREGRGIILHFALCLLHLTKEVLDTDYLASYVLRADDLVVGRAGFGEVEGAVLACSYTVSRSHSRDNVGIRVGCLDGFRYILNLGYDDKVAEA